MKVYPSLGSLKRFIIHVCRVDFTCGNVIRGIFQASVADNVPETAPVSEEMLEWVTEATKDGNKNLELKKEIEVFGIYSDSHSNVDEFTFFAWNL